MRERSRKGSQDRHVRQRRTSRGGDPCRQRERLHAATRSRRPSADSLEQTQESAPAPVSPALGERATRPGRPSWRAPRNCAALFARRFAGVAARRPLNSPAPTARRLVSPSARAQPVSPRPSSSRSSTRKICSRAPAPTLPPTPLPRTQNSPPGPAGRAPCGTIPICSRSACSRLSTHRNVSGFEARLAKSDNKPGEAHLKIGPDPGGAFHCLAVVTLSRGPAVSPRAGRDYCERNPALLGTRDSAFSSYTPLTLMRGAALEVQTPVYRGGPAPQSAAGRRGAFVGWLRELVVPGGRFSRHCTGTLAGGASASRDPRHRCPLYQRTHGTAPRAPRPTSTMAGRSRASGPCFTPASSTTARPSHC